MSEVVATAGVSQKTASCDGEKWKPTQREINWFKARIERGKRERFTDDNVAVTPGLATLFMQINVGNRPLNRTRKAAQVDRLQRGDFILTHQGAAVAKTGVLNDGQHRFAAIIETGLTAPMAITFGAEREEFSVIDQGKPRGAADILGIMGENHTALRASVAKSLLQVKEGKPSTFDPQLIADYATELRGPAMDEAIRVAMNLARVSAPTPCAVAYYWIAKNTRKPQHFEKFWDGLKDGENLSGVKLRLREWMRQKQFNQSVADHTIFRAGGIVNAWNSFVLNKRTFSTQWKHVAKLPDVL